MFSNLQNKIDLRKLRNDIVEVDGEFIFKEDFDIVNQVLVYFQEKKHKLNNVIIKEEVIEYENSDTFNFLEKTVREEQNFIYNDPYNLDIIRDADNDKKEMFEEGFKKYHKEQKLLPKILKEANDEARTHLDAYRMVDGISSEKATLVLPNSEEYDTKALFDGPLIDVARNEYLESIYTINWLEKQLVDYRNSMNANLLKGSSFQIDNGLKALDVNDTEEIKNKIKDLQESIKFLKNIGGR